MDLGRIQTLTASRETEHGFYLTDENGHEVLLPGVYVNDDLSVNDTIEVFIYKDSDDRLVATTETPKIKLHEVAVLSVKDVNRIGAFVDWGLPKDLLVPFAEQNISMRVGYEYPIFLFLDNKTERLAGSTKINKYLNFIDVQLEVGDKAEALVIGDGELGLRCVVNQEYYGLVFHSDVHKRLKMGDTCDVWVKNIREDGKLDLVLEPIGYTNSIDAFTQKLLDKLEQNGGQLQLTDKSSPESIKAVLGLSKKAFKKSIGKLYKDGRLILNDNFIQLK